MQRKRKGERGSLERKEKGQRQPSELAASTNRERRCNSKVVTLTLVLQLHRLLLLRHRLASGEWLRWRRQRRHRNHSPFSAAADDEKMLERRQPPTKEGGTERPNVERARFRKVSALFHSRRVYPRPPRTNPPRRGGTARFCTLLVAPVRRSEIGLYLKNGMCTLLRNCARGESVCASPVQPERTHREGSRGYLTSRPKRVVFLGSC